MRALVLSGGGGLGSYQSGALTYMLGELGIQYPIVVGASVGAINAAVIAQHPLGDERKAAQYLDHIWRNLSTKDVITPRFLKPLSLAWEPSLYSFAPLKSLLHKHVSAERLRSSGRRYRALAVDLATATRQVFTEQCGQHELIEGILASASTPVLHPSVQPSGSDAVLYDGGLLDITPTNLAIELGATELDIILTQSAQLPQWHPEPDRIWNTLPRTFDIMFRELVDGDLRTIELYNALVEARHARATGKREIKVRLIRPDDPLPMDSSKFDPGQIKRVMDIGYDAAKSFGGW